MKLVEMVLRRGEGEMRENDGEGDSKLYCNSRCKCHNISTLYNCYCKCKVNTNKIMYNKLHLFKKYIY